MELELYRKYRKNGYSIGLLYIDGKFICNTLEDTDRGLKSGMTEAAIAASLIPDFNPRSVSSRVLQINLPLIYSKPIE